MFVIFTPSVHCSVFPAAVGRLVVKVKLARSPEVSPDSPADQRSLTRAVLALLMTSLESSAPVSPLVSSLRYSRDIYSEPELVLQVVPSAKWGKHFTLEVSATISSQGRAEQSECSSCQSVDQDGSRVRYM